eukprot:3573024-Pleurochrysis_carterae.AAC.3
MQLRPQTPAASYECRANQLEAKRSDQPAGLHLQIRRFNLSRSKPSTHCPCAHRSNTRCAPAKCASHRRLPTCIAASTLQQ